MEPAKSTLIEILNPTYLKIELELELEIYLLEYKACLHDDSKHT